MAEDATAAAAQAATSEPTRDIALQAARTAIDAIDTLLNLSMYGLGALAVVLALIAVFGWVAIRSAAVNSARDLAGRRLDSYIEGEKFAQLMEDKLTQAIERRWQDTVVIRAFDAPKRDDGVSEFPAARPGDDHGTD